MIKYFEQFNNDFKIGDRVIYVYNDDMTDYFNGKRKDPYGEEEWEDDWGINESKTSEYNLKNSNLLFRDGYEMVEICKYLTLRGFKVYNSDNIIKGINNESFNCYKWRFRNLAVHMQEIVEMRHKGFFVRGWINRHKNVLRFEDLLPNHKKKINPEIDPYNEEDWGYETYINESKNINRDDLTHCAIMFNNVEEMLKTYKLLHDVLRFDVKYYNHILKEQSIKYYNPISKKMAELNCFVFVSGRFVRAKLKEDSKMMRLTYDDIKHLKGKYKRIENIEIDPYSEEDWGYETEQ